MTAMDLTHASELEAVQLLADSVKRLQRRGVKDIGGRSWPEWLRSRGDMQHVLREFGYDPSRHNAATLRAFISELPSQHKANALHSLERLLKSKQSLDELRSVCGSVDTAKLDTTTKVGHDVHDVVQPTKRSKRLARLLSLVQQTRLHSRFDECYSFPSHGAFWAHAPRPTLPGKHIGEEGRSPAEDVLMSMDCEMVKTENDENALARVCVCSPGGGLLLDRLVKPPSKVLDPRTDITGITVEDLEEVDYTMSDAQADLRKLVTSRTVMVGHSLNKDLEALRFDCHLVIDTAFVYGLEGDPRRLPSLAHLVETVLKRENFRGTDGKAAHNCADDAQAALDLVLHRLKLSSGKGGDAPVICVKPPETVIQQQSEQTLRALVIHRIPDRPDAHTALEKFFASSGVKISELCPLGPPSGEARYRSTKAIFGTLQEVEDCFKDLVSIQVGFDRQRRPQKMVSIPFGGGDEARVYIRTMAPEVGAPGTKDWHRGSMHSPTPQRNWKSENKRQADLETHSEARSGIDNAVEAEATPDVQPRAEAEVTVEGRSSKKRKKEQQGSEEKEQTSVTEDVLAEPDAKPASLKKQFKKMAESTR